MNRIDRHPVLGSEERIKTVTIYVDGEAVKAYEGEVVAAALHAVGKKVLRYTRKHHEPRGIFCAIGRCTDCIMTIDGVPNIRTCVTHVREGMVIQTQYGLGEWRRKQE